MLTNLLADIRYSLRGFRQRPSFAIVIVLTLAFGIGVNVAVFTLYDGLLLEPLPVEQPEGLVNFVGPGPKPGSTTSNETGDGDHVFSYPMFRDLERADGPFAGVAAQRLIAANLGFAGETAARRGLLVSGSFFPLLGLKPALGRLLGPEDDRVDGEASVVVLSYGYWTSQLGSSRDVIGRKLVVNGRPLTIVGVSPRGYTGNTVGAAPSVFLPITFRWLTTPRSIPNFDDRRNYWVYVFARLKPGVSREQAEAAVAPTYHAILSDVEAPLQTDISDNRLASFRMKNLLLEPGARGQSVLPALPGHRSPCCSSQRRSCS